MFFSTYKVAIGSERNKEVLQKGTDLNDENSFIRMRYILESQNQVLSVINEALDLGFLDKNLIRQIMIHAGLLLFSESGEKYDPQKLHLAFMRFITEVQKKDELVPQLKELLFKAIQTLKIVAKMRENLQMFILLKLYRKYETSAKEMKKTMEKVFDILSLFSPIDAKLQRSSLNSILAHQITTESAGFFTVPGNLEKKLDQADDVVLDYVQKIDQEVNEYSKPTVSIDMVLLKIIFDISRKDLETYSSARQNNSKYLSDVEYVGGQIDSLKLDQQIRLSLLDVITDYYDQRFRILQKLLNVEIIYGEEEKKIYQKLTDNSDAFSLSAENLANHVAIVLTADIRYKSFNTADLKEEYRNKIRVLEDFLDQLTSDMNKKYTTKIDFKKTQNLLKNKGFHEHMLKLLSIKFQIAEHTELFTKLVRFFCLFCLYNTVNKKLLSPHITSFIDLIGQSINTAPLVSIIGQAEADPKASAADIDYIFNKINLIVASDEMNNIFNLRSARKASKFDLRKDSVQPNLQMLLCYKTILSGMVFDEKEFRRDENQRKIIFYLVNNRDLVKIFEFKYFNEIKHMLAKEGEKTRNDDHLTFYKFYAGYLSLLADASWEFVGGIDQARRVLTKEQLLEVLTSPNTPLYFKKHFLKCFHHVVQV